MGIPCAGSLPGAPLSDRRKAAFYGWALRPSRSEKGKNAEGKPVPATPRRGVRREAERRKAFAKGCGTGLRLGGACFAGKEEPQDWAKCFWPWQKMDRPYSLRR